MYVIISQMLDIIPSHKTTLVHPQTSFSLCINAHPHKDLQGILITSEIPENLTCVRLKIGGSVVVEQNKVVQGQDVLSYSKVDQSFGLPLFLCDYMHLDIEFLYSTPETTTVEIEVDEYRIEYHHDERDGPEFFFDQETQEVRQGYPAWEKKIKTGKKVMKFVEGVEVTRPEVRLLWSDSSYTHNTRVEVPLWQPFEVPDDEQLKKRLLDEQRMEILNDGARFKNILVFYDHMAGLKYSLGTVLK